MTSYWSFLDQAFIIPDGTPQSTIAFPIWNGASFTGKFASLPQENLYLIRRPASRF